ncbi:hypothetical protein [Rhodococcus sp. B10]|uniref:hypothetical protein n=1 Tax=Rhodococcus sp. B10 TaxID=2695876 RepID=UPI001431596B|nr:hypothetical protein [Rhodococcus sp. B10]NIL74420.1 hypothetical protein [Rhodococcus sp. B10]
MTAKYSPLDALKYAAVLTHHTVDWTTDSIMGRDGMTEDLEESTEQEFDALRSLAQSITDLSVPWVRDRDAFWRYSDGRPMETRLTTDYGSVIVHTWHPDPDHPAPKPYEVQAQDGAIYEIAFHRPSTITATHVGYWRPRLFAVRDES